jgi:hypothetical protein
MMGRSIKKVEVDGISYQIGQLMPTKSIKLLTRILKIVGRPAGMLTNSYQALDVVIGAITDKLEEETVVQLLQDILSTTVCMKEDSGKGSVADNFDIHFIEYGLNHLFKLVRESLEVLYGDFFAEKGILGSLSAFLKPEETAE